MPPLPQRNNQKVPTFKSKLRNKLHFCHSHPQSRQLGQSQAGGAELPSSCGLFATQFFLPGMWGAPALTQASFPPPVNFCICFQCSSLPTHYLRAGLLSVNSGARATHAVHWIHLLLPLLPARSFCKAESCTPLTHHRPLSFSQNKPFICFYYSKKLETQDSSVLYYAWIFKSPAQGPEKKQKQNTRVSFTSGDFRGA